jgi:hypothetical protein
LTVLEQVLPVPLLKHSVALPHGIVQRLGFVPTVLHKPPEPAPQSPSAVQEIPVAKSKRASHVVLV